VVFGWALQHIALPFIFDWPYLIWRFLAFVPGVLLFVLVYRRTRRLPPLIVAHWPMDIAAVVFTIAR
jgi:membrane protease YdiL (CAAX protease family)